MDSRTAKGLKIHHQPVAIIFTDDKPEGMLQVHQWTMGVCSVPADRDGEG